MKDFVYTALFLAVVAATSLSHARAQATKLSYDNYKLVQTRNIFDPERRALAPQSTGGRSRPVARTERPPARSDYVALTGVMVTDGKSVAFFGGSRPDYNKVLPVQGVIAGATVTKITPSSIEVERDGKKTVVAVGQTVPFDNSSPGTPPAPAASTPAPAAAAPSLDPEDVSASVPLPSSTPGNNPSPAAAPAVDTNEVMRRMMERRQQQMK